MSKKFLSPIKLAQGSSNPATGTSGEIFFNTTDTKMYVHNGISWVVSGGGVTVSDAKPSSPSNGDLWYYSAEGTAFVYYNDGNTSQWVQASSVIATADPNPMPAGSIMAWGGSTAPTNWMICDGSAISRSTYASLFSAIGTTYGSGDGSTTFNLPNLKGKVVVGLDSTQTEFDGLGETGGAKTVTLDTTQIPSHTHTQDAHTHTGTTSSDGNHTHSISITGGAHTHALPLGQQAGQNANDIAYRSGTSNGYDGAFRTGFEATGTGYNSSVTTHTHSATASTTGAHTHTFTTSSVAATNQYTGGGGAHNNLQPYIILNYIIKISAGVTPGDSVLTTRVGTLENGKANISNGNTLVGTQSLKHGSNGSDVVQFQTSDGTAYGAINTYGDARFGTTSNYGGKVTIDTGSTTNVGLTIRGIASQAANLQSWQISGGTTVSSINSSGMLIGKTNTGGTVGGTMDVGSLSARGDATNAAVVTFHRPGYSWVNAGLDTDNNFKVGGGSLPATAMQIDTSGRVLIPNQPAFHYNSSGGSWTAGQVISFNNGSWAVNTGSYYNTSNMRFTAPIAGRYYFYVTLLSANDASSIDWRFYKNGGVFGGAGFTGQFASGYKQTNGHAIMNMAANDYVDVRAYGSVGIHGDAIHNSYGGYLIG